jgi:hypothetical protein
MRIVVEDDCRECYGRGSPPGAPLEKCSYCRGARVQQRSITVGELRKALTTGCRPGAWGSDGCLAHEGHEIGDDGLCIEGRAVPRRSTDGGGT